MIKIDLHPDCRDLSAFKRLYLGFSGGLDSTVLLHILASEPLLLEKITAIHINHGLSPKANDWEKQCFLLCQNLQIPLISKKIQIRSRSNLEEEARRARYAIFSEVLSLGDALLLAHHRDDQAETVLLQLFRGAGIEGLSAIQPYKTFAKGHLLRPLLHYPRSIIKEYAAFHQLPFVEDESNTNCDFSRNFLRHKIIPQLQERWPGITANLSRTASHCLSANFLLNELAGIDYPKDEKPETILSITKCKHLSKARLANVLRSWLKSNAVPFPDAATFNRLIPEVIFAKTSQNPQVVWDKVCVRRYQQTLYLLKHYEEEPVWDLFWPSFPKPLELPTNLGVLKVDLLEQAMSIPKNAVIEIRFRQGGESIVYHGQTKHLKKLFQEWKVPTWMRGRIPLLYIDGNLAAIIGYAVSDIFCKEIEAIDPVWKCKIVLSRNVLSSDCKGENFNL